MIKKRLSKTFWYGTDVDSYGNPVIPPFTADPHDLEGLHVGELFLHFADKATLWTANESGNVVNISGGNGNIDLSQYLLTADFNELWEIRYDSSGTAYIFGKLPLVTQYGITMYSGENVNVPGIYDGLPIDNTTIYWDVDSNGNKVLKAVVGSSGGGVADSVAWANVYGKPLWLTDDKPVYSYSEIKNTPDLSVYALKSDIPSLSGYATEQWVLGKGYATTSDLDGRINALINGAPQAYDTLKEIADVLQGNVNSIGDILTTLGNKADKATTLGGYGITDAKIANGVITLGKNSITPLTSHQTIYTLTFQSGTFASGSFTANSANKTINIPTTTSHISEGSNLYFTNARAVSALTDTLKAYVTLAGTQTITGEKNFTGGLKVNGSPIVYDSRGFWKLEGDLIVTGGVTMYGNDTTFTPSTIMDAIVVDGTTISKEGGVLKVIGGTGGGGIADSVAWGNVLGKPSWITDNAPIIGISGVNVSLGSGISQSSLRTALGLGSLAYKSSLGKADVGLGNVENTALSTWVGTNKITTLGTITTGVWNGTKIANTYLANSTITISGTSVSLGGSITQSALRTALGLGSNAYSSTAYLPLTGGTLSGSYYSLTLKSTNEYASIIKFENSNGVLGFMGLDASGTPSIYDKNISNGKSIWHSGNFTPSNYVPLTGGVTMTGHLNISASGTPFSVRQTNGGTSYINFRSDIDGTNTDLGDLGVDTSKDLVYFKGGWKKVWHEGNDGSSSGLDADLLDGKHLSDILASNVASATKLATARTIWGQSFDGTGNVSGDAKFDAGYGIWHKDTTGNYRNTLYFDTNNLLSIGLGTSGQGYNTDICGNNISLKYGTSRTTGITLDSSGNVKISKDLFFKNNMGISTEYSDESRAFNFIVRADNVLNIGGGNATRGHNTYLMGNNVHLRYGTSQTLGMILNSSGNITIGSSDLASTNYKLYVNGNTMQNGKIYFTDSSYISYGNTYLPSKDGSNSVSVFNSDNNPLITISSNGITYLGRVGNVCIGTKTTTPTEKLYVQGSIRTTGEIKINASDTPYDRLRLVVDASGAYIQASNNNGSAATGGNLSISAVGGGYLTKLDVYATTSKFNGNILATGGVTMQSARKLKNIQDERGLSLEELKTIKPKRFTWKDGRDNKVHIGGIADDVMKVLPEVIYKTEDDTLTMDYGNAAFAIAASLIKPVINHEEEIRILKERIKELEEKVKVLTWNIA